jgi:DNA-binding NarL/FixJ family response regulator
MKTGIIIFDRQDITRLGMETLISKMYPQEQDYEISVADTKDMLVRYLISNPDSLAVIDYTLSDMNSVNALLNISARFPKVRWILFSDELSVQFLKKVLCNDAFSVVLKSSDLSEIETAVSLALDWQVFVCANVKELLSSSDKNDTGLNNVLTLTEKEVLREIFWGKTAREIAATRNISMHTVFTHRKNIYRKLEVNNSQEASIYALRAGILDTSDYSI